MENFVLYEELGRTSHTTVYKGRRRGTIDYVAVICIEKSRRSRATNWVRCIHSLKPHQNIVKFKEWYETNRHLWLVIDLCSGGTLREILRADKKLPIQTVRQFGIDIARGLYFLHNQASIAHGDLTPDRVFLDGGLNLLKISNLSLAQKHTEKLGEIFKQIDAECDVESLLKRDRRYRPADEETDFSSQTGDLYSFGCMIHEMVFGYFPSSKL
jgi:serine/threonine-protein kinase ULK4